MLGHVFMEMIARCKVPDFVMLYIVIKDTW